jgi:hypothetical protein
MTERLFEGTVYATPFPKLLFQLWRHEAAGSLRLKKDDEERTLYLDKGRVVIDRAGLGESDLLKALVKKRILPAEEALRCERHAAAHNVSILRDLTELEIISPLPLWNLLESFFVRRWFPVFDWDDGRFVFEAGPPLPPGDVLGTLLPLEVILQGIRQMRNTGFIAHHLPDDGEPIYVAAPYFLHQLALEPHEKYALNALQAAPSLARFYAMCAYGKVESQKTLFAFACLDILSVPEKSPKLRPADPGPSEQGKVLAALNEKCACAFKYITKQIGPLGRTIIGNALDEVKPALGPMFQTMRLQPDGRVEVDSAMVANINHLPEDLFRVLVRGFDEILTAEVLAVKKSLGAAHESALVKAVEKAGCL